MRIKEINSSFLWKKFLNKNFSYSFLQTWEWGEFQKSLGNKILRLGIYERGKLKGIALVVQLFLKRGRILFIPHGPLFSEGEFSKYLEFLVNYLKGLAKEKNFWFLRIAPILKDNPKTRKIYQNLGFKIAPIYLHAEKMWILNLNKAEEEILKEMRKTTRYLIRKGEKIGIKIEKRTDPDALKIFWDLYQTTAKTKKFVPFSFDYLQKEFSAFKKTNNASWFLGKFKNQYLAGALIIFTKFGGFYHQGASIHTPYPVSYLLQWEAIKEAKKRGCLFYNFWGIYQPKRTPKSWEGLTLFKTGFGGHGFDCVPTLDLVFSPKYYFTYLYEKWLNFKRGV